MADSRISSLPRNLTDGYIVVDDPNVGVGKMPLSTLRQEITNAGNSKADKVTNATDGNFAALDENGNLKDSGFAEAPNDNYIYGRKNGSWEKVPQDVDDWIDITDEWIFLNTFTDLYLNKHTLTIMYSPSRKLVKFSKFRIYSTSSSSSLNWVNFLQYTGSRFYTTLNAPNEDSSPKLYDVQSGVPVFAGLKENGETNGNLLMCQYIGNPIYPQGGFALSMKGVYTPNSVYGILGPLSLSVTPIPQ